LTSVLVTAGSSARAGFRADGVEIVPPLVWRSRFLVLRAGLRSKVRIHKKDLWAVDLSPYDVVIVFGLPMLMDRFAIKMQKELKPDAVILANKFQLPGWRAAEQKGDVSRYVQGTSPQV